MPVTTAFTALALVVTVAWGCGVDVSSLFESAEIRRGEAWRLVTSAFLHVDAMHLIFNCFWLWEFGYPIERTFGRIRTALLYLLLIVASGTFDFGLAAGSVGLSGLVYGLFGLLWVLSRRDDRFRGTLQPSIVWLMLGWLVVCVFLTWSKIYNIANVAHGAGLVFGVLLGFAVAGASGRKAAVAAIAMLLSVGLWGATLGRPYINISATGGDEEAQWGYDALVAKDYGMAVRWLKDAARYQPRDKAIWTDLAIADTRAGDLDAAAVAAQHASELPDEKADAP